MAHGHVEGLVGYTGTQAGVEADVADMVAQMRQRALIATWQQRMSPDGTLPWWEGIVVDDNGEQRRVAAGHVNPDASDADEWGIVDGRLPHEPVGGDV